MKKSEKEQIRQEILIKNIYLRQLRVWFLLSMLIFVACIIVAFWGFSGLLDPFFPQVSVAARQPFAWIATIFGTIAAVFSGLIVVALINGRKHVLSLIDKINGQ